MRRICQELTVLPLDKRSLHAEPEISLGVLNNWPSIAWQYAVRLPEAVKLESFHPADRPRKISQAQTGNPDRPVAGLQDRAYVGNGARVGDQLTVGPVGKPGCGPDPKTPIPRSEEGVNSPVGKSLSRGWHPRYETNPVKAYETVRSPY